MKIIDISNYQGHVDFTKVKASGIEGVVIRASEGAHTRDELLQEHYEGAKSAGLMVGFYHYIHGYNNPVDEAKNFISVTQGMQADFKYMVDVEDNDIRNDSVSDKVRQFINYMNSQGKPCVLYTYLEFSQKLLNDLKDIPLWIAAYQSQEPSVKHIAWQYSSSGIVDGISGKVDMDEFAEDMLINKTENTTPAAVIPHIQAQGTVQNANAVIKGDWLYVRDVNGNILPGHRVDIGDKIRVDNVFYHNQLALMEYPVPGGTRKGYVKNCDCICYFETDNWGNGSTDEIVYDSPNGPQIGKINPREKATKIGYDSASGFTNVVYNTDKGIRTKSGWVKFKGI